MVSKIIVSAHSIQFWISNHICNTLDDKKKYVEIFLDLVKAFDTIYHERSLDKLDKVGIKGIAFNILKYFWIECKEYVLVM